MKDITGPVVVLYADVSGSTRLYEQFGDKIARADVAVCLEILTGAANEMDGEILKSIGDEIMCLFPNPVKAALAATNMQTELREAGEDGKFQSGSLRIKIGWHYGPAFEEHGDLLGEAPTVAQQIIKLAKADEVLTSGQALAKLPPELRMTAHRINRIRSEVSGDEIEVFVLPWEEGEDVTRMSDGAAPTRQAPDNTLVLEHGGRSYKLDPARGQVRIGRSPDNDMVVEGKYTSRHHAVIIARHGRYHLRDESVNGTVVVGDDGRQTKLRREEGVLPASGTIGFGGPPEDDPPAAVRFRCD